MPLGSRDIMMVVRARDLASRTLRNVGNSLGNMNTKSGELANRLFNVSSALTTIGLGMAGVGTVTLNWLNDSTNAAMKYNREAALTLTQTDGLATSLEELKRIGRDVAREIPAPFQEMQEALYDIFSSMDVSVRESEILLRGFAKAGVAGQVELGQAARGTIGIMNAYRLEANEVHRVNDIMFQLVRKGVGTYAEFADTIGLATPAAVRAGQSFETLAGMMAFLTRNGLDTSAAAAAAGRALENLADPRIVKRLEDMGITVRDASGNFLPLVDVVGQLSAKLGDLPGPERAAVLQELLKGAGNSVQARRFWNLAITNFDEFQQRVDEMINSSGALDEAYEIMFEDPQVQIQLLKNQYEILRTEIGDQLIPAKMRLAEIALRVLDAWNSLSDSTKTFIIRTIAIGAALATVVGIVLTLTGAIGGVIAILMSLGLGFGAAIAVIGGLTAALIAIPAIIYVIWRNFDTLKKVAGIVWGYIKQAASAVWQTLQSIADWIVGVFIALWPKVKQAASDVWQAMQAGWDAITDAAVSAWHGIQGAWDTLIGALQSGYRWFDRNFGEGFRRIFRTIGREVPAVFREVVQTLQVFWKHASTILGYFRDFMSEVFSVAGSVLDKFGAVLSYVFETFAHFFQNTVMPILRTLGDLFMTVFNSIVAVVQTAMGIVRATVELFLGVILAAWNNFATPVLNIVKSVWNGVSNIISGAIKVISNIIQLVLNLIQGDWRQAWNNVLNIFKGAWQALWGAIQAGWGTLATFFRNMPGAILGFIGDVTRLLWQTGKDILKSLLNGLNTVWDNVVGWFRSLGDKIISHIPNPGRILYEIGRKIIGGLWDGMKSMWKGAAGWVGSLPGKLVDLKGPPAKDAVLLTNNGRLIMQGLQKGLMSGWRDVEKTLSNMTDAISPNFNVEGMGVRFGSRGAVPVNSVGGPAMIIQGDLVVREERVVDDMDWFARTRLSGV